jgi:hypothetical protein
LRGLWLVLRLGRAPCLAHICNVTCYGATRNVLRQAGLDIRQL